MIGVVDTHKHVYVAVARRHPIISMLTRFEYEENTDDSFSSLKQRGLFRILSCGEPVQADDGV